jgi:hypothetical protein
MRFKEEEKGYLCLTLETIPFVLCTTQQREEAEEEDDEEALFVSSAALSAASLCGTWKQDEIKRK